jgi:hypothetical protein
LLTKFLLRVFSMTSLKVRIIFYLSFMGSVGFIEFLHSKYFNDMQYFIVLLVFYIIYVSMITFIFPTVCNARNVHRMPYLY